MFILLIYDKALSIYFSSFSNDFIPFFIFSHDLDKSFTFDKIFSKFSFIFVTSFFRLFFKSSSSLFNFSLFNLYDLVVSSFTLSYSLSIAIISFSILFFKLSNSKILSSKSFDEYSILKFSFFKASLSSIPKIL